MSVENLEKIQTKLELITRKWWFFLIFILIQFIPPYASKGFEISEIGVVTGEVLSHSLVYNFSSFYLIFKILPLILIIGIILFRNRVTHIFNIYVVSTYFLFAFLQNIAFTEKYGLAIITINIVMFLLVALFWIWEAAIQKNDFTSPTKLSKKCWIIPLAFLAFWYPINLETMVPDFNILYLFTNEAGLTFCMMTPVYISLLILYYPRINLVTLRVTSLVGAIIGFYNILTNFIMFPSLLWWNGILHLPLISISVYGLIISLKKRMIE
ncbi:MAG TPA: hypothetical protein DCK79_04300 [Candidatus Atribacteria bacterium]|nr:hypothetical protein [Candidatus Atribacteria bacterium]